MQLKYIEINDSASNIVGVLGVLYFSLKGFKDKRYFGHLGSAGTSCDYDSSPFNFIACNWQFKHLVDM